MLYKKLTLKGTVLRACGDTMWRGIYYNASGAALVTTSDSAGRRTQIWDADYGARLEYSNGTYQLEKTDFINNRVGVYVNQVKPNSSSYIRGCNFYTSTDTQSMKKMVIVGNINSATYYNGQSLKKSLYGVQLNLTDGVVVGSAVECQSTQNRFFNLHCGMYSFSSGFTALNNSFEGSTDTAVTTVNDWWRTGIFANGDISPTRQQKIQIGDGSDCGMNRFYNGRFGVCLKNNNASDTLIINRNRFTHAYLADVNINSAQNAPRVEVMYNSMDSGELAGDGIRALGCVNSALYLHHNFIVNVPLTKVYTAASPYPKRSCGIVVAGRTNSVANRALKIYENYVTQAIYGIYSLNNKAVQIFNNEVATMQVPYLRSGSYNSADSIYNRFTDNVAIMSTYDDNAVISNNATMVNGVITPFSTPASLQNKVTGIAINSNVNYTQVYCNQTSDAHWGILGLGTNTGGVDIRNNRLNHHESGISIFGTNATIGNQGIGNCPTSTGSGGSCPSGTCPCTVTTSSQYTPDNSWAGCNFPLGIYAYGNNTNSQQILLRDAGTLPMGWTIEQLNPALNTPNSCGNPNANNSSLIQYYAFGQPNSKFTPRCASVSTALSGYTVADCADLAGTADQIPKFQIAQLEWWERIATNRDTINDYILSNSIHHWRITELLNTLLEFPQLRDSSKLLDSFYQANVNSNVMLQLQSIMTQAVANSDSTYLANLKLVNSSVFPSNIQESNLQKLNSLYLTYFSNYMGTTIIPDSSKQKLLDIASQCYVTGGPSVFMARSLYWNLMNDISWKFQDDCIFNTGFFKTDVSEIDSVKRFDELLFFIYPNPVENKRVIKVFSSFNGELVLTNNIGEEVLSQKFEMGGASLVLSNLPSGLYVYSVKLNEILVKKGKLVLE